MQAEEMASELIDAFLGLLTDQACNEFTDPHAHTTGHPFPPTGCHKYACATNIWDC